MSQIDGEPACAGRDDLPAIGAERHGEERPARRRVRVATKGLADPAGVGIAELDRLVASRRSQGRAVGAEGQPVDRRLMGPGKREAQGPIGQVPDLERAVIAAGGQAPARRIERDGKRLDVARWVRSWSARPSGISQTRTWPSANAAATHWPSGLKATP